MGWKVQFYHGVENDIRVMPVGIRSRMTRLLELIESKGPNLGEPHTKSLGNQLFEVRAKGKEGVGRSLFCYQKDQRIIVLHAFVKKTQKTPRPVIELALKRKKEIENGYDDVI